MMRFIDFRLGRGLVHEDAHVDRGGAVRAGEHRVEVDLGELREVVDEVGQPTDDLRDRLLVDRLRTAYALEHLVRGDAVDHRARVGGRGRRQPEGHVLEHLDEHAAETERDDLAEGRVGDRPDDDLLHVRAGVEHLLHLDTGDRGLGVVLLGVGDDLVVGLGRRVGVLHPHHDAAGVGLVQDLRRDDFHDDGEPDLARQVRGLLGRPGQALARRRDAVRVSDPLGLGRAQ
jgi:hypothetical protein